METSKATAATAKAPPVQGATKEPKPRQRRQYWFVVTAPKTTKLDKHRFLSKRELRDFLKSNIKNQNFVFFGSDGQVVPETQYDVKLGE